MPKRFIRVIVCLCMVLLPLPGWAAMLPFACHQTMAAGMAPAHAQVTMDADQVAASHQHVAAHLHSMPPSPGTACALCASCAACTPLTRFARVEPALLVLFYRVSVIERAAYASAQADVPHPPPRSPHA